jgi:hypothetical protein
MFDVGGSILVRGCGKPSFFRSLRRKRVMSGEIKISRKNKGSPK